VLHTRRAPAAGRHARRRAAAPRRRGGHGLLLAHPLVRRPDGGDRTVLLDARLSAQADPCPDRVRRHCAHEVAFCVLTGLAERFARAGRRSPARLALALRLALPVDEAVRIALRRDLDAFGPA
jgi:hypothetical protein